MNYQIQHRTVYAYSEMASLCHSLAHLSPRGDIAQTCLHHVLSIDPQPAVMDERVDYFGNRAVYFAVERPHREMVVAATSLVRTCEAENAPIISSANWRSFSRDIGMCGAEAEVMARAYVMQSPMIPRLDELRAFALTSFEAFPGIQEVASDLMTRIHDTFAYDPHFTTLATPLKDVLVHRRGVCQDFAHLAIGCLRSFGLAARYVSGYLETLPPPGGEKLVGADASHAWVSVYTPDAGWVDFDPTNNQRPDHRYIVLSWGRDYADVTPLKGVIVGGGYHRMSVSVDVAAVPGE